KHPSPFVGSCRRTFAPAARWLEPYRIRPILGGRDRGSASMSIRAWMAAVACCLLALAGEPAGAQSYPTRTIRIVVPFPAGGPTDVAARLIAPALGETLGQSVIVENQTGAGGRIGSRTVARSAPDGYTLLMGGTNLNAIIPAIYQNLDYDPVKSFV